jgi:hypothetical protein
MAPPNKALKLTKGGPLVGGRFAPSSFGHPSQLNARVGGQDRVRAKMISSINGEWIGEYGYDDIERPVVPFTLLLRNRWLWWFVGTVQDGVGGMPDQGTVSGLHRGRHVTFKKRMPRCMVLHEERVVFLDEYVASAYGTSVDRNTPHPTLRYEGVLAKDGNSITGIWHADRIFMPMPGAGRAIAVGGGSGPWRARRRGAQG